MNKIPPEFEKLRLKILEGLKKAHPEWSEDRLRSVSYATATEQWKKKTGSPPSRKEKKLFCCQTFDVKEEGNNFYVDFLLATTHPDNAIDDDLGVVGDIISKECLLDMADQWNSSTTLRKGSVHHKRSTEIPSVGQAGARVIDLDGGEYGLLATAKLNSFFDDKEINYSYDRLINEIKDGILDAVSIEYYTTDYDIVNHDGKNYRQLNAVQLDGFGHASRPLNDNCSVLGYGFKELNLEIKEEKAKVTDMEARREKIGQSVSVFYAVPRDPPSSSKLPIFDKVHVQNAMARFNQIQGVSESEKATAKRKILAAAKKFGVEVGEFGDKKNKKEEVNKMVEEPKNVKKPSEEPKSEESEEKELKLSVTEHKEFLAYKNEKVKAEREAKEREIKDEVAKLVKEELKAVAPMLASGNHFNDEKNELPAVVEYKEALKTEDIARQWQAANKLVNTIGFDHLWRKSMLGGKSGPQNFECKGTKIVPKTLEVKEMARMKGMEFKTLTTASNDETTYYQSAAELNDIYEPVIYNQFNDQTRTWGRLQKVNHADRAQVQFRMGVTRNTSATFALETKSTFTASEQTRIKCEQNFAIAHGICQVSGLMIAENRGRGGMGDIWGEEVRRVAIDLLKHINETLLTGASGTYDGTATNKPLGFQMLVNDAGNLYGKARGTYAALKGTDEAMSSAELKISQMRKMARYCKADANSGIADARVEDLLFITSYTLLDKFKAILHSQQQQPVYSTRAGFQDLIALDGIPILPDPDADSDDMFLMDLSHTKIAILVAPRLEDLKLENYDGRKGFIKTYFTLYCTKPSNNYWCSGFKTT